MLIDGSSFLFRAYYALPALLGPQGQPTGAIHGVVSMLRNLHGRFPESLPVVVFDTRAPTFRHLRYTEYKANRDAMPEDLAEQIAPIHTIIGNLGLPLIKLDGFEADDIIATYARQAAELHKQVLVVSSDKDLMQLVNDSVQMYDSLKNKQIGRDQVFEKFGVWPEQIADLLCLTGDSVDNIPGVPKVGPKTAAKWLGNYQTLDNLLAHSAEVGGVVGQNLRDNAQRVVDNRGLVLLDDNTPVPPLDSLAQEPSDQAGLQTILHTHGLRSHMDLLQANGASAQDKSQDSVNAAATTESAQQSSLDAMPEVVLITDTQTLQEWVDAIVAAGEFAYDCETTGLDFLRDTMVGMSLALPDGRNAYIPLAHQSDQQQLSLQTACDHLHRVWCNPDIRMIGQNLKFDLHFLQTLGIQPTCVIGDTMLQSYCLNATGGRHDLNSLAERNFSYTPVSYESLVGTGKQKLSFDQVPLARAAHYAGEDAWIAMHLHQHMQTLLLDCTGPKTVYDDLEIPLVQVLLAMEHRGIQVDAQALRNLGQTLGQRLLVLTKEAHELAGNVFNLDSPRQLGEVLFGQLGLHSKKKTAGGSASTSEAVLQELAPQHALPALMLDYRMLNKLKSTYTDTLAAQVNPVTGRLHTSFQQAVAATGRLSSSNPNLQNLPIRTDEGRQVRAAFVADAGTCIVAADYSQIELRIMAHLSEDANLLEAFSQGLDVHNATAAEIFGVSIDSVDREQRRSAKAINFGLIYGMSAFGLARQLGISNGEARDYIDRYFSRYPGVQNYMQSTKANAVEKGYVETMMGRRVYLPAIKAKGPQRQGAERLAINAPVQGSAADIIKLAMLAVHKRWGNSQCKLVLQVHDELVFEIPQADTQVFIEEVKKIMEEVVALQVPLVVDAGFGKNWLEAHGG